MLVVVSASGLGNGCIVVELALRLPRSRADVRPWESGRGDSECESVRLTRGSASEVCPIKKRASPSVDARGASVRFASRDSRAIQRIGRDAGNCVAQTERGAFRSSSLGDKLPRSVFRLGRASRPLRARHICRARLWRGDGEEVG